ncbi:MAG: PAS domain S-box protein [Desulfobacteraceae bacterium]|jgi:PAS domain S-box-containing protein
MSDMHNENQPCPVNIWLDRRIGLLEDIVLENERSINALQESEKRYRRLFESAKDGILILDANTGKVDDVNPFLLQLLGYSYNAIFGKHIWELGVFKDIAASKDAFRTLQDNEYIRYEDLPLETHDGRPVSVEFVSNVYLVDQNKVIQCNIRDITERKQADAERKRLMTAIEQSNEIVVMTDAKGNIQFVNQAFERTTGYCRNEAMGQNPRILNSGNQDDLFYSNIWDIISSGGTWEGRMVNKRKDGTLYTEESTISPVFDALGQIVNYVAVKRDITKHLKLEAQFQHAQKMESVGLLAGGVAHDYNNMLSVILGYTELAMKMVEPGQPLHSDLNKIYEAAMHSTDITRQLMAFARKQIIIPVVVDLNTNIAKILNMLRRLIGENIDLAWRPYKDPCVVKIDPGQIDQIIANLCVNAMDAIADTGTIIIETGHVVINDYDCAIHPELVKGEYALLSVTDDGCGMNKEILDQIFEPFFTSKGIGKGTGLGLSTVYGIIKQNNGFIYVESEPGKGTNFKIYLKRYVGPAVNMQAEKVVENPLSQGETVLLVEDEPMLMKMQQLILEKLGYRVLAAGLPSEALELAEKHTREISLVITDVVMPEMNGLALVERLNSLYPGMKNLFMSGYTADAISHGNESGKSVNFIQKPFSVNDLALKVREVLEKIE